LKSNWSPLPAPLTPPADAEKVEEPISPSSAGSAEKTLSIFLSSSSNPEDIAVRTDGEVVVDVAPERLPWRGYWFPLKSGRLHAGSDSPLAKFDRFVQARSGRNPGAQRWEKANHAFAGVAWSGHCNGWAAASIMTKEPVKPWSDPISGVTFSVEDQKGILIERNYCPEMLFIGHRYRGGSGLGDISALDFHNTITYYIGKLGKPVLVDIRRDAPVENRVFSGYKMTTKTVGVNVYEVTAEMHMHGYDSGWSDEIGVAHEEPKLYKYKIWTDAMGAVTKAQWLSTNPDFIWIPLASGTCSYQNPAVSENWVSTIGKPVPRPGW
jgi:hypothetical protein